MKTTSTIKSPTQPSNKQIDVGPRFGKEAEGSAMEEAGETKEYEKHEVESAAETLMRAHEMAHMTPKLHEQAMLHLKRKNEAMTMMMAEKKPKSLDDLRKLSSKKSSED